MSHVHLKHVNYSFVKVEAEKSTLMELSDHFTYYADNYKFHPKYKNKIWDGKIRLLRKDNTIYAGLAKRIKKFCDERNYTFSFDEELYYTKITKEDLLEFINDLNIPKEYSKRDYQIDSVLSCIKTNRRTLLSPTSSGKSLQIYLITRWYKTKTLIIVPTIGLVEQMKSDFISYGYDGKIETSINGLNKSNNIDADIVITTWQSLDNGKTKMKEEWYHQFELVFGDEAHGCAAKTLINILSNMTETKYRFGTTGTLNDNELNKITIEGLFGPIFSAITTKEMIDQGYATKIKIKCIVLEYSIDDKNELKKQLNEIRKSNISDVKKKPAYYNKEIEFITKNEKRNKFIKKLTLNLSGNKLLLFRIKEHGKTLQSLFDDQENVYYIDGDIKGSDREKIRHSIEDEENAILIASSGTTSTGVSIKKLHHMIFGSPMKAYIKLLQSIGRMLRLHFSKDEAYLYDIVDDFSFGNNKNFALLHFIERCKIYDREGFDYTIHRVRLK